MPYVDTSHVYHGQVLGEPNSYVFGSIIDGVFQGKIITDTNAYYIEHAKHYFPNNSHKDYGFHSVIYDERDVIDDPHADKRKPDLNLNLNGCGINEEVSQWMNNIQNSAVENDLSDSDIGLDENVLNSIEKQKKHNSVYDGDELSSPHFKYSKEANNENDEKYGKEKYFNKRSRRAARPKEDNRNTCSLYIQTDPLIWRHIREGIADVSPFSLFYL